MRRTDILPGIQMIYRDDSIRERFVPKKYEKDWIYIEYCLDGYVECKDIDGSCDRFGPNDLYIWKDRFYGRIDHVPNCSYRGISIQIRMQKALESLQEYFPKMENYLENIWKKYCLGRQPFLMKGDNRIRRIFHEFSMSEIWLSDFSLRQIEYFQLKILELLFLLEEQEITLEAGNYYPKGIVEKIKSIKQEICKAPNKKADIKKIASLYGISVTMVKKGFRQIYGQTIPGYIRSYRLDQAAYCLLESRQSILEIAAAAGYENPGKFAAAFRKKFGISPREYRRMGIAMHEREKGEEMPNFLDDLD